MQMHKQPVALNALCERLLVSASTGGLTARLLLPRTVPQVLLGLLPHDWTVGCDSYDKLLAAAAELLASPDLTEMVNLQPAADSLIAYSHGLMRASDL